MVRKLLLITLVVTLLGGTLGCDESSFQGGGGILCQAHNVFDIAGLPVDYPAQGVSINGEFTGAIPNSVQYGNVYSFAYETTDETGQFVVVNAVRNAYWYSQVIFPGCGVSTGSATFPVTYAEPVIGWICDYTGNLGQTAPSFVTTSSLPASITVSQSGFSTQYGAPQLQIYLQGIGFVSASSATSVTGSNATFTFPKQANGSPLSPGLYAYNASNRTSSGQYAPIALGFFSVGWYDTSNTTPYGVDAVDETNMTVVCTQDDYGNTNCTQEPNTTGTVPLETLSSKGQVRSPNGIITVGSEPTAIKAYGSGGIYSFAWGPDPYGGYEETFGPPNAIVTNFASNTVSILDLVNAAVQKTISVGAEPVTVVLNSNQSKAYVANYGSSTVSEIDLSSNTQSRVATVGPQPEALAMDPGGSALWVGGLNYISQINLSNLSPTQSFSVGGQVTSIAVSAGQNTVVYTTMATSSSSTTFQVQQAAVSNGNVQETYAQYVMPSSTYYAEAITTGGPAPGAPGWLMSSGALVNSNYGNGAAVVGTPTGFVVIDLDTSHANTTSCNSEPRARNSNRPPAGDRIRDGTRLEFSAVCPDAISRVAPLSSNAKLSQEPYYRAGTGYA